MSWRRILDTSFFEWCVLWLIAFLSGVSVFVITNSQTGAPNLYNYKLPDDSLSSSPSRNAHPLAGRSHVKGNKYNGYQGMGDDHDGSNCPQYGLVTRNKLSFTEALARLASKDKVVILAYVDMGFLDMAQNFIEGSLSKHGIDIVLFFSTSAHACDFLESKSCRACYVTETNVESEKQSLFGSKEFINKMNLRTQVVLSALEDGYHVIHTDLDVVFLRNPLEDLKDRCQGSCDVAPLWDTRSHNAGFIYVRSTEGSMRLYQRMIEVSEAFPHIDDQEILNTVIQEMTVVKEPPDEQIPQVQQDENEEEYVDPDNLQNMDVLLQQAAMMESVIEKPEDQLLNVLSLSQEKYLSGLAYFVHGHRNFAGDNPCATCLVVHNNWLVEKSSKLWRFKENHLWVVDSNGYYSDLNAKYLSISNNVETVEDGVTVDSADVEDGEEFEEKQQILLENAFRLATCLKRVLILPILFASRFSPPTPAWLAQEKFLGELIVKYNITLRESTFLSHTLVPNKMKGSKSTLIKLAMEPLTDKEMKLVKEKKLLQYRTRNQVLGPTKQELMNWFSDNDEAVLNFDSVWNELKFLDISLSN